MNGNETAAVDDPGAAVGDQRAAGSGRTVAEVLALGAQGIPSLVPTTWGFNGVAVGQSGANYVSGDKANLLYRFD